MIEGINGITYSTDRWSDSQRFFADWGLIEQASSEHEQQWSTLNGCQVRIVRPEHPHLPAPIESGSTLREVHWALQDAQGLETLAERLHSSPGFVDTRHQDGSLRAIDPHGLALRFSVNHKRLIGEHGAHFNPWGHVQRIDTPSPIYERATPIEVGHVVLFTDRLAQATAYYERLGFVVSDQYPGRGVFLRCAPRAGHHDLFLLQLPGKACGLNHVAFTVRDIHEVFGGGLHMSRCGWKTQLGPGRHPISSAYFWYFDNPCGGLIEYNADEDHLTEAWKAREFAPSPTAFAEWAIDGGIDGHTRRQVDARAPDGRFLTQRRD
jgi:catechol 2,3-dioxygenase-like lactoylglutathione lyase family enzyme